MNYVLNLRSMWERVVATLSVLLFTTMLCGQDEHPAAITPLVFSNTAYIQTVRYGAFSLMHTSRYAVSRRVELGFHPILIFLSPGVEVKWKQIESERYTLSSFHSIKYVSPLLRTVQMQGAGGLISPEFDMPDMIAFQNGVMASSILGDQHYITGKALFVFSINSATPNENSTIDLPVIYPRSAVYYKTYGFITGLSMEGKLFGNFSYLGTADAYFFPHGGLQFFSENQFGLIWRTGKKFMLMGGGELTYGEYPYGPQWHLLPVIDFRWFMHI